jgi:hypothetical protein
MKNNRLYVSLIMFIAFLVSSASAMQQITLTGQKSSGRAVKLSGATSTNIILNISLPGLNAEEKSTKDGSYLLLSVPDYGYSTELGCPKLPVLSEWVEIPQGAMVDAVLDINTSESFDLKDKGFDKRIIPVQLPIPKVPGGGDNVPFSIDKAIYTKDAFYGEAKVTVSEPVQLRGHRAVLVSFWPVAYNPANGDVKVITKAKITLKLSGADLDKTSSMITKYRSSVFDSQISSALLNYGQYQSTSKTVPALPINELIIVGDQYYEALQPLVAWDTQRGFRTVVTRTSEIPGGADTTNIRLYIKNQYNGDNPPDFVLLVGDTNTVPAHIAMVSAGQPITDLYYSTVGGTDYMPDFYISRISVTDTNQLHDYIVKYLGYQQGQWTGDHSWMQKAFFTASTDNYTVTEGTDNYCIALSRAHGIICDSAYQRLGGSTADITDAFNNGITIMTYTGHGSTTSWATPAFYQNNVNALTNDEMFSFVTSFACLTGDFAIDECFGETWIRAANKGAVAYFGSSEESYWDEDDILQKKLYHAFLDSGYAWIGGMVVKAKLDYFGYWGNIATTKRYFEMYNILGSGSIDLYNRQPLAISVSHPITIPIGPTAVNVTVTAGTALQNALVCLTSMSTGEQMAVGYTDGSGSVSLDVETSAIDSIKIVVTAHNCEPYIGRIEVASPGPFVVHYKHSIIDSTGNNNGLANPGEYISMPLWVKNYGNVVSSGTVKGTLRTSSSQVAIVDSFYNFGLVYPGDSAIYASGYKFSVAGACSNGTVIPFVLECHDTDTIVWKTTFNITIYSHKLIYSTYSIIDPSPANNNGFAEPGETDSLRLTIKNTGLQDAENVIARITSSDPYVSIIADSADYGTINVGETGFSTIPYTVTFGTPPTRPYFGWINVEMRAYGNQLVFTDSFSISIAAPGFYDSVEDSLITASYQTGYLWHTTEYTSYSPATCWRCGVGDYGNYVDTMNSSLITPEFVTGSAANISFWHKYWMETTYDYGYIEYSIDGGKTWIELDNYTGTLSNWTLQSYDVNDIPLGSRFRLRFRFYSDPSITALGWHIDEISVSSPTGVSDKPEDKISPAILSLGRSYPNPMRSNTVISYQLPKKTQVKLAVYNILGQSVRMLDSGEKTPGTYHVNWDGRDNNGRNLSSGIYFYRLSAGEANLTQKLIIIR